MLSGYIDLKLISNVAIPKRRLTAFSVRIEMMTAEEIHSLLTKQFDGAEVTVEDLTGTNDHFQVTVMWAGFRGKGLIEQHQMVNKVLANPLEDGRIHALKIKTYGAH